MSDRLVRMLRSYRRDRIVLAAMVLGLFARDETALKRIQAIANKDLPPYGRTAPDRDKYRMAQDVRDLARDILPLMDAFVAKNKEN